MARPYKADGKLTVSMRRFAELYTGNGKEAAIAAGYAAGGAKHIATELLKHPGVQAIIKEREEKRLAPKVKSVVELQQWWSSRVDDSEASEQGRIKASELLARSHGAFFERSEVAHKFPSVLPEKLDKETLIFLARGGLDAAAPTAAAPEGDGADDDDDSDGAG